MKIKILDIFHLETRATYSQKLKEFEKEFSYPLGESSFSIVHGLNSKYDYFSFFEQMGKVFYLVIEKNDQIVGAGCLILRTINNQKVWYFCDFKITKKCRGLKLLEKITVKYFLKFYLKSQRMISVNMKPVHKNSLVYKIKNIFKLFKISTQELYFFEWNIQDLEIENIDFEDFYIITNINKKDIIINQQSYPIYHLIHKNSTQDFSKFKKISWEEWKNNPPQKGQVMYCDLLNDYVKNLLTNKKPSNIGTLISHRVNLNHFSSAEI
jgi:hypothetical protein